jgi:hypothetical protein
MTGTIARSSLLVAQSPYDIQVINGEGLAAVGQNKINIDTVPLFVTGAGSLGTFTEGDSIDVTVEARDPDSSSAITFELQSGSLPAGLSLVNQSGDSCRITGTASAVTADTTSNFTLRAFDSASNTVSRAFSITINDFSMNAAKFNDGSSDYLSRTPGSASNRTTWTWSAWIKRGSVTGTQMALFGAKQDSSNDTGIWIQSDESLQFFNNVSGTVKQIRTNRVFRDSSAWFHIVATWDSSNGTAGDRMRLYINGTEQTSFQTDDNPGSGDNSTINNTQLHQIGRVDSTYHFDGYMSEINFVDGTALTPTSFGETDSNGVWVPKNYTGSYGTNGFKLDFADAADLGDDESGNGNDYAEGNLTSVDKVSDSPQNNSCTFNPLYRSNSTFTNGNLIYNSPASNPVFGSISTFGVNSGKWYAEVKYTAGANHYGIIGICDEVFTTLSDLGSATNTDFGKTGPALGSHPQYCTIAYVINTGAYRNNNSNTSWGSGGGDGDIINVALDRTNRKVYFGVNGTYGNSSNPAGGTGGIDISSLVTGDTYFLGVTNDTGSSETLLDFNFGAGFGNTAVSSSNSDANGYGNFEYAVPSGFYSWNTKNLAEFG